MASQTFADYLSQEYKVNKMRPEDWLNALNEFVNKPEPVFTTTFQMIQELGPYMRDLLLPIEANFPNWKTDYPTHRERLLDKMGSWHLLPNTNLWSYLSHAPFEHFIASTLLEKGIAELLLGEMSHISHDLAKMRTTELDKIVGTGMYEEKVDMWRRFFKSNKQHPNVDDEPQYIKKLHHFEVPDFVGGNIVAGGHGNVAAIAGEVFGHQEIPKLDEDDDDDLILPDDFIDEEDD